MIDRKKDFLTVANYVRNFDVYDPKIMAKVVHTCMVTRNCEAIANGKDVDLAWLIGLLHDIGRFQQLKKFNTFYDLKSVNHALYSVKILFEDGFINEFDLNDEEKYIVKCAIANHNAFEIEPGLDERTLRHCKIIRDADKIDIFRQNIEEDIRINCGGSEEEVRSSIMSDKAYHDAMDKKCILITNDITLADRVVLRACLFWDINYPISKQILIDQKYYFEIFNIKFDDALTQQRFDEIKSFILKNCH